MGFIDEIKRLTRSRDNDADAAAEQYEPAMIDSQDGNADSASRVADASTRRQMVSVHTTTQLKVVLVRPERFEDVSDIADCLKEKRTVVMSMENAEAKTARRIIDFLSGVTYAQEGKMKRVSASSYLLVPFNVDVVGDVDLLGELGGSDVSFFS